ncbi:hypothetical protein RJD38_19980 [Vibrio scophthalmi]|uniref:Chromosome partition protein Smc n=1 Tax=Vibrio scophthalmi TaxID=45658 RepID=A0A1C7FER4_9VIBR|nr:hypothetical protein [Vibrio scophthalmi]ANU38490.1 hypothetical protein VSVS05_03452 [Vibrio scophthalmi]
MLQRIGVTFLAVICLISQTGCAQMGLAGGEGSAISEEQRVHSATEEKILKEATVAGTIGGVAVSAIVISTLGKDWPVWLKAVVGVGGTLAIKEIAEYIAMDQISSLNDITLENDEKEALLTEARKVNADVAKLNSDLKDSINNYKKDQTGLSKELAQARLDQEQAEIALENRKQLLTMLVEDSAQYNEFKEEVTVLEKENKTLASIIDELSALEVGAV